MKYKDLPQVTKYYLHELELIAAYRFLRSLPLDDHMVKHVIFKNLGESGAFPRWEQEVFDHIKILRPPNAMKGAYLLYYLVADAPILTTLRDLKISQARYYELKNTPPMEITKRTRIEGFFVDHPDVIPSLNKLVRKLGRFNGYYILGS